MYTPSEIEKKRLLALERKKIRDNASSNPKNESVFNNYINKNVIHNSGNKTIQNYFSSYNKNSALKSKASSAVENFKNKCESPLKKAGLKHRFNPLSNAKKFYGNRQCFQNEIQCSIISNDRFSAIPSQFNVQVIDLFKTIPSRIYDAKSKIWNFHINEYGLLKIKIQELNEKEKNIIFKAIPKFVLKAFENSNHNETKSNKDLDLSLIDSNLIKSLYPFQKEGIEYGITKNGKCLIADDMGLGKTRQALGIACYYKNYWPLIIITPSSVRYQWSEAVIEHLPSVPIQSIQHITSVKDHIEKCQITIISYELLVKRIDEIAARKFGVVICDESHYLKSNKTLRTKAVQKLSINANSIILLSGTPALSRPIELYSQIKLLLPNFLDYKDYGLRYCAGFLNNWGYDFTGSSNLKELDLLLKATCLIRRLKSDVMTQLPLKIRQKIILDPNIIKASTKEMLEASKNMEKKNLSGLQKHSALLEYYSITSRAKEKAVCNYITDLVENEQKFLIFAHHQNMLDAICLSLELKKIKFIRIDGKTNPEQRKKYVDSFQNDKNILVAVLSIMAANAGITLTAASVVIFAELSWNPGILCQAEDRVHRIGQTESVVIRYLLAKGTADDYLWPAIQKKTDILSEVGLEQNLDLNQADVAHQSVDHKKNLNNFLVTFKPSINLNESETTSLHANNDSIKNLLNENDDIFDSIDLGSIS